MAFFLVAVLVCAVILLNWEVRRVRLPSVEEGPSDLCLEVQEGLEVMRSTFPFFELARYEGSTRLLVPGFQ